MKNRKYDVVIIGAGPSGSLCARNLAAQGYSVLLAEKRPVVGSPVRCGEATGRRSRLAQFVPVNEDYIETDLEGVILHGPGGITVRHDQGDIGLMLDRKLFDQDLARQAQAAGAELSLETRITDVKPVVGDTRKVSAMIRESEAVELEASLVVGADGAEALAGRWVGLKTRQLPPHVCSAIEFRVKAEDANPRHLTFWHGHDAINKGYIWVFPKVKSGVVNLGAGILTPKLGAQNMHDLTMEYKRKLYPDAEITEIHGGAVPVSGSLAEYVADRFLLVGDAAHHTNPLTGGGIMSGIVSSDIASKWIDKAFKAGRMDAAYLAQYRKDCWKQFVANHEKQLRIRNFVMGLDRKSQIGFYSAFKGMVDAKLSTSSKIAGYARLASLALRNWKVTRMAFFPPK